MRLSIGSKSKTNCDSLGLASRQLHVFAWSFDLLRPLRFAGVITLVMVQYDTQLKTALLALWSGGWRVNGYCWLVNYEGRIWSLILAFDKPSIVIISFHLYPTPCFCANEYMKYHKFELRRKIWSYDWSSQLCSHFEFYLFYFFFIWTTLSNIVQCIFAHAKFNIIIFKAPLTISVFVYKYFDYQYYYLTVMLQIVTVWKMFLSTWVPGGTFT